MRLWEQVEFLAALDRLGAAAGAELVEDPTAVSFHGVLAHEEGFADLAVGGVGGGELGVGKTRELCRSAPSTARRRSPSSTSSPS